MPQCHNFVSGISSFCLQSQNEKLDEKKSCWDCKQSVEVPDTKLWHCDIFFKHSCNLWIKDLKNIWLWIRSVTEGGKFQLVFFLLLEEQVWWLYLIKITIYYEISYFGFGFGFDFDFDQKSTKQFWIVSSPEQGFR